MKGLRLLFEKTANFLVTNDFVAKVLCLLLAVILWSYLDTRNQGERNFKIKAEFRNLPREYSVSESQQKFISVMLKGNKDDLLSVNRQNISVYIDLQNPVVGQPVKYPVEVVTTEIPDTIKVDLAEDKVFITVENMSSRFINVVPEIKGTLADGYLLGNVTVQPDRIKVSGAESDIKRIDIIRTNPVNIQGMTETNSSLIPLNTDGRSLDFSVNRVKLSIEIIPSDGVEKIRVPLSIKNLASGFSGTLSDTSVDIFVRPAAGHDIHELNVSSYIDLSSIDAQSFIDAEGKRRNSIKRKISIRSLIEQQGLGTILAVVPDRVEVQIVRSGD